MEKGTLKVIKTKKGFQCKISYTNKKGKDAILPVNIKLEDDNLNDKSCLFERNNNGQLKKIEVEGKQLLSENKNQKEEIKHGKNMKNIWATNIEYLRIPNDTSKILQVVEIDNYYLKLNKAVHFIKIEKDKLEQSSFNDEPLLYRNTFKDKNDNKIEKYFEIEPKFSKKLISEIAQKNLKTAQSLIGKKKIFSTELKLDWRMIVGLGGESIYETSITLHHIYGIPYIPASSIKGVVRSYIINEHFGNSEKVPIPANEMEFPLKNAEGRAIQDKVFCDIFGCPEDIKIEQENGEKKIYSSFYTANEGKKKGARIGENIFFDAFPLNLSEKSIKVDIMNPHYPDYYDDKKGKTPPTDFQNPRPIPFLTVEDTKFQFIIGSKKEPLDKYIIGEKSISKWLKDALENHGIGAKTAVGYGRMK